MIQAIWGLVMDTGDPQCLRNTSMVFFGYYMNGLRESLVLSLRADSVQVDCDNMVAPLSVVKGRLASTFPLVPYRLVVPRHPSPVDVWMRWTHGRGRHNGFFGFPGERKKLPEQSLTDALARCLLQVHVGPPAGGKLSSHSLRVGARIEQVLLGIPLELRFGMLWLGA